MRFDKIGFKALEIVDKVFSSISSAAFFICYFHAMKKIRPELNTTKLSPTQPI
jgi:hypothetical protein